MPKSKRKKARYTPQARPAQPASAGQAATATAVKAAAPTTKASGAAVKPAPGANLGYVRTELKIIGAITGLILVAIVAVYFLIR